MRPDSLPRLWRYINLLLTYLLVPKFRAQPSSNLGVCHVTAAARASAVPELGFLSIDGHSQCRWTHILYVN